MKISQINQHGISLRPARPGDGNAVFQVTQRSVHQLANGHYSCEQLEGWMGERTPDFYEGLISAGRMVVAGRDGVVVGFVDEEPGELTRLFLLAEVSGIGLGRQLLQIGIDLAKAGHDGKIRVESTKNAEEFYRHHGFMTVGCGHFSQGIGGDPIDIVLMER